MLKKLAKIIPILIFVFAVGFLISVIRSDIHQLALNEAQAQTCPEYCGCKYPIEGGCWCEVGGWRGHRECTPDEPSTCPPGCGANDCIEQRTGGTSAGATSTYIFYCDQLSCTHDDGVTALRCDSSNSFFVRHVDGVVQDPCQGLPTGPGGYRYITDDKACECAAYQVDWMSGESLVGWKMGDPPRTDCTVQEPTTRTVSGRVYCEDSSGTYAIPNITMTIIRNGLDTAYPKTNQDGNFSESLTGTDPGFAVRLPQAESGGPWVLPDGELPTGQAYSDMDGPTQIAKDNCQNNTYEMCVADARENHTGFDFKYSNCSPPPAPQCTSLSMADAVGNPIQHPITPQQEILLTCNGNVASGLTIHYQFRVGRGSDEPSAETISTNNTHLFSVPSEGYGGYAAQCRICTGTTESSCQEWEYWPL